MQMFSLIQIMHSINVHLLKWLENKRKSYLSSVKKLKNTVYFTNI